MNLLPGYRVKLNSKDRNGTVVNKWTSSDTNVYVEFDDNGETELHYSSDLELLTSDKGHCHGCGRLSTLTMKRHPGKKPHWECTCGFENRYFHSFYENGNYVICRTCNETLTQTDSGKLV